MYKGDSFFTLSAGGQIGLAALSVCLAVLTLYGGWRLGKERPAALRVLLAFSVFFTFVWASPQVYYQYYRIIIEGLPAQWVIGAPPSLWALAELMVFRDDANLSNHSQGALGWALCVLAVLRGRPGLA